jgi:hypothetical protein
MNGRSFRFPFPAGKFGPRHGASAGIPGGRERAKEGASGKEAGTHSAGFRGLFGSGGKATPGMCKGALRKRGRTGRFRKDCCSKHRIRHRTEPPYHFIPVPDMADIAARIRRPAARIRTLSRGPEPEKVSRAAGGGRRFLPVISRTRRGMGKKAQFMTKTVYKSFLPCYYKHC